MAPPKRRSCLGCVRAKRRCDLANPRCQRCTVKDIACDYQGVENRSSGPVPSPNEEENRVYRFHWNWMTEDDKFRQFCEPVSVSPQTNDIGGISSVTHDAEWALDIQWSTSEINNLSGGASNFEEIMNSIPLPSNPNESHVMTEAVLAERVRFASLQLKKYPEIFYKCAQTPFIHWSLYKHHTPEVIQDALSACSLYCGKNVANEDLVYRDISRKARDLTGKQNLAQSPLNMLACTQALLLYQIIQLFDGDIRQRADAESHELVLKGWTEQLQTRFQQLPSITIFVDTVDAVTSPSWQDWIYQESCRRTVLTSYMLQGVYSFLKSGYDNVSCKVNNLSFTAQKALWYAPSEFHWEELYKEKRRFEVIIREWDIALQDVKPDDLDELGILIMASLKGLDLTSQWLGKENLERWGL